MWNTDFSDTRTRVQQKYSFGSQAGGLFLQWTHTSGLSTNITCRNFTLGFLKTQLAVASTRNSLGTPWTQSLWGLAIPRVTPKAEEELAAAESLPCCTTGNLSNHFWSIYITYLVCFYMSCLCAAEDHVIPWDGWFLKLSDFPFSDAKIHWVFAEWCHLICHLSRLMVKECFLLWWWSVLLDLGGFWTLCLPGKLKSGNLC